MLKGNNYGKKILTTNKGAPVTNDQSSITTGKKSSYALLQDTYLVEKLAHFDRERIPERVVHAKRCWSSWLF